jgi:hypothetical protein
MKQPKLPHSGTRVERVIKRWGMDRVHETDLGQSSSIFLTTSPSVLNILSS